jgi:leucyl-tRNA synthetase
MKHLIRFSVLALFAAVSISLAPMGPSGCAQYKFPSITQQSADQIILRAEQTAETAKLTFNTFVHLERDNETLLKQLNPQIHVWAENIRAHGIDWIVSLRNATKTFKANRTSENQASLNTILTTLTQAIADTNKYITQSKTAIHQ